MARTAVFIHAVVSSGHRIEIAAPAGLAEGDAVDVVLLTGEPRAATLPSRSLADVLDSLPGDIGMFNSAGAVDAYIREERDSWE